MKSILANLELPKLILESHQNVEIFVFGNLNFLRLISRKNLSSNLCCIDNLRGSNFDFSKIWDVEKLLKFPKIKIDVIKQFFASKFDLT